MNYDLLVSKAADDVLYDILNQNIYQLVQGQLEDQLVVDVGANKGVFAYFAIHVHKAAQVLAFEPSPKNYQDLLEIIDHDPRIIPFNLGVGKRLEKHFITDADHFSQISDEGLDCTLIDLHTIVHSIKSYNTAVLKMDIEGSEYDALYSASSADIQFFNRILIEVHGDAVKRDQLIHYLEYNGFRVQSCFDYISPDPITGEDLLVQGVRMFNLVKLS